MVFIWSFPCTWCISIYVVVHTHTHTHTTSMHTKRFDKCLTPRAVEDLWGHLSNHLVCMLLRLDSMCACVCIYTFTYGCMYVYLLLISWFQCTWCAYIGFTQTDTNRHTRWFDKCLTPRAGEDLWGQAFVEPLGVYAGVPRRRC